MSVETILVIIGILILFSLYKIYRKIESFADNFESWYGDWNTKNPYRPEDQ